MKYMIASDIHGSSYFCEALMKRFQEEKPEKLVLLGDLLYHGPRNALPELYDTEKVLTLLNGAADQILCVRGNCDSEVDQVVLSFPMMADYAILSEGEKSIFVTHGHIYNESNLPTANFGGILLHGHTHVSAFVKHETFAYMNPGSVSIPKGGTPHGYMTLENGEFLWKTLEGEIYRRVSMNEL